MQGSFDPVLKLLGVLSHGSSRDTHNVQHIIVWIRGKSIHQEQTG